MFVPVDIRSIQSHPFDSKWGRVMKDDRQVFSHVHTQRLSQLIEQQIREALYDGHFQIGEKLPSERELAEMFGASRPVVREALRSLENAGLLAIKPGVHGGAYLTPMTKRPIVESLSVMVRTGQISHEEILQTRLIVEPPAAAEAAKKATQDDISLLDESIRVLEEGFKTGDVTLEHNPNPNLHRLIAGMTGNQLLIMIVDVLMDKTCQRQSSIPLDSQSKSTIAADHKAVVQAIKSKDSQMAFDAMKRHVLSVYEIHTELERRSIER